VCQCVCVFMCVCGLLVIGPLAIHADAGSQMHVRPCKSVHVNGCLFACVCVYVCVSQNGSVRNGAYSSI